MAFPCDWIGECDPMVLMGLASLRGMGYAGGAGPGSTSGLKALCERRTVGDGPPATFEGTMTATHTLRPVPVTAVQYDDNIPAIEAAFGPATLVWVGALEVAGHILGRGQWLVRFHDTGEVKVYEPSAFEARFEVTK